MDPGPERARVAKLIEIAKDLHEGLLRSIGTVVQGDGPADPPHRTRQPVQKPGHRGEAPGLGLPHESPFLRL